MPKSENKASRESRQTVEVETNQAQLLESIAETERLVEETDTILRRHWQERTEADE